MILQLVVLSICMVAWGAHPLAAWRLAPGSRRTAALLAMPIAVAALIGMFAATTARPDSAIAVGLGPGWPVSAEGRFAVVLLLAALVADALALFVAKADETSGRGLAAALGGAGLVGFAIWAELLRLGEGPANGVAPFWLAVTLRAVVALGAGELLLGARARLAPLAAVALLAYPLALPAVLRDALQNGGDWLNLAAAGALFLLARQLPGRFARFALAAAVVLAAVFFVRTAELSQRLQVVFPELWPPPAGQ